MKILSLNPTGEVKSPLEVNTYVNALAKEWDEQKTTTTSWFLWWSVKKASLVEATSFILNSVDELVKFVDDLIDQGPDKKATVLAAVGALYDYIAAEAMPIFLKPFNSYIKSFLVDVVVSSSIDFIVDKYNNGLWKKDNSQDGENE